MNLFDFHEDNILLPKKLYRIRKSQVILREHEQEGLSSEKEKFMIKAWEISSLAETLLLRIMYLPEICNVIFSL